MIKDQQIESEVYLMEPGRFQTLSGRYLKHEYGGELHQTGSTEGSGKPRKGKPDLWLVLKNGQFFLAEVTTKDSADSRKFYRKLEKDLKDLLNFEKLGINPSKVDYVALICNSSVEPEIRIKLDKLAQDAGKLLIIVTLGDLVHFLTNNGRLLARDFLSIPLDTGQILTKTAFLERSRKGRGLATPLDNALIARERELGELVSLMQKHQTVLVAGKAGIGKSRIALEAIDQFLLAQPEYTAYCIVNKSGEAITHDLNSYILPGGYYLVFIDDVNRQLENLSSVHCRLLEPGVNIKIIATVRDYARADVQPLIRDLDYVRYPLRILEDQIIRRIVSGIPWALANHRIITRIAEVSKGNPRLAIMAAEVVMDTEDIELLRDVSVIYDTYFESIADEAHIFTDEVALKVLGLISFFQTLEKGNGFDLTILKNFGITEDQFAKVAEELEAIEVVEIYEKIVVRITEQTLGAYLFYQAFVVKRVLALESLFRFYLETHHWRFKDTLLTAISTFGPEIFLKYNYSFLISYWKEIEQVPVLNFRFLNLIGEFVPDQVLEFVYSYIVAVPDQKTTETAVIRKFKGNSQNTDETIALLTTFLEKENEYFKVAAELLVQFAIKRPQATDMVTDIFKKATYPSIGDFESQFRKIEILWSIFTEQMDNQTIKYVFYYQMEHTLLGGMHHDTYYLNLNERTKFENTYTELRVRFWNFIITNFTRDQHLAYDILINHIDRLYHVDQWEVQLDSPLLQHLISKLFTAKDFAQSYFVHQYANTSKKRGFVLDPSWEGLKEEFRTDIFKLYQVLTVDEDRYEQILGRELSWHEVADLATEEIRNCYPINDLAAFKIIYQKMILFHRFAYSYRLHFSNGVGRLLESVFNDFDLGYEIICYCLKENNELLLNPPIRIFQKIYEQGLVKTQQFYNFLEENDFENKNAWLQRYFENWPTAYITPQIVSQLLAYYSKLNSRTDFYPQHFLNFETAFPNTVAEIMEILTSKYSRKKKNEYKVGYHFFKESPFLIRNNFKLCKKIYYQQERIQGQFDHDGDELFILFSHDKKFFFEYCRQYYRKTSFHLSSKMLSKIWEWPEGEQMVHQAIALISSLDGKYVKEHMCSFLFYNITEETKVIAAQLLTRIITTYRGHTRMLNIALDIARNHLAAEQVEELIKHLLNENDSYELFAKLHFYNHHYSYQNGVLWSEFKSAKLSQILKLTLELPRSFRFAKHRVELANTIAQYDRHTEEERKWYYRGMR